MENISGKADFLQHRFTQMLSLLDENTPAKWGKMNVRQMIEHLCDYVRVANGRLQLPNVTAEEHLPRMQGFLASEKPFRENTPNSLMSDEPDPVKRPSKEAAIAELQQEIDHFFNVHAADASRTTPNPFFGTLNFEQQVQLLYKHCTHHLRQFGAME